YKLDPAEDLLVLVDDVALPTGRIRLRARGSAGGHNGLTDIERLLGTDNYGRCRIGIDAPGRIPQKDYVLGRFTEEQEAALGPALERACDAAACWAAGGMTQAMNLFNPDPEPPPRASRKPAAADADAETPSDHVSNGAGADSGPQ
ncbi:MAG: peptidyl-tRNA hydrolase, partial [Phycisphaerales bacterium]|nr:peptidyl-tRNA hydrolase [Phycisphaerales bacterium]